MKKVIKSLKEFILEEDAKISKKALILGGLGVVGMGFTEVTEAGHGSNPTGGGHNSQFTATNHQSAIAHHSYHRSHSSY